MVREIYNELMSIQSDTGTSLEGAIGKKIYQIISGFDYFKANPKNIQMQRVEPHNRMNVVAFYKGILKETIVLLHHHDAVDLAVYESLKDKALSNEVKACLKDRIKDETILKDLADDTWIFGRGSADMKSGAAIQIDTLRKLSEEGFEGSILLLSVCDEENLSAGMRAAMTVLKDHQKTYDLNYKMVINSEPTPRIDGKGIIYEGTVGKMMPVCVMKGIPSHIGEIYQGFNPLHVLSHLHTRVELNPTFTDCYHQEQTPAPTWVYYRDHKNMYDASIPEVAAAYFSVLSLDKTPSMVLDTLSILGLEAMTAAIAQYNSCVETLRVKNALSLKPKVINYASLHQQLLVQQDYVKAYENKLKVLHLGIEKGEITLPDASIKLIELCFDFMDPMVPCLVIGLSGPFYPSFANHRLNTPDYLGVINEISSQWQHAYSSLQHFMGICDFSYTNDILSDEDKKMIEENLIGWGTFYDIPFHDIKGIRMPMMNIGPWGKDLHKITERVHAVDAFEHVPLLMYTFIKKMISK